MLEGLDGGRGGATATEASATSGLLRDQVDSPVEADGEHLFHIREVGVLAVVQDERPVAAEAGGDRLARLGVEADVARQGQQLQRLFERQAARLPAFGEGRTFRLATVSKLHIWPEAAGLQEHLEAALGIGAEHAIAGARLRRATGGGIGKLQGVAALGVVGAADEGAELAQLQRQLALAAVRAVAGIGAVGLGREDMVLQRLVQRIEHFGDAQVLDVVGLPREVDPELAQHVLPVERAGGNLVELLLEAGGEAVLHQLGEEVLEEGGDDAAAILGDERALFKTHVVSVLQHAHGGGVGGGSADAELFHLLDEAGFGVTRRRLGEVLLDQRFLKLWAVADIQRRQFAAILIVLGVVGAILLGLHAVKRQETWEGDDRADGPERDVSGRGEDGDVGSGAFDFGRPHLAGERALPDQLVEPVLV